MRNQLLLINVTTCSYRKTPNELGLEYTATPSYNSLIPVNKDGPLVMRDARSTLVDVLHTMRPLSTQEASERAAWTTDSKSRNLTRAGTAYSRTD